MGLLDALKDPGFYRGLLDNTRQLGGGLLAGTIGAPVDIATMLMRPFGYKTPDKNVYGSSEQIAGLLGLDTNSLPYQVGSLLPNDPTDALKYGGLLGAMVKQRHWMEHRPMTDAGGAARLHDLATSFQDDIYGPISNALQYYGSGDKREAGVLRIMQSMRGRPDAEVTIYRGVPKDAQGKINPGDWVTLDPGVAKDYGDQVVAMKVRAKDITSWPDSLLEFGYHPQK